ncbi:phosphoenolpyruvate carboxykinase [Bellilinea caldifistulae]|uniref:phosphoenolpyruvate carboxykinase n=1 Tax=Bellilinea caldifistulae TaxID=360411 RepID=UPI0011AE6E2D|nr:phosphoenolpyruvate carboxykinase [Bellilinea caldifistulae]
MTERDLIYDFVENLYNYWRSLHRVLICDRTLDEMDRRPYRTFAETVERLMHVVRSTYRDIQENITGSHPRVYRQVSAGVEIGAIALPAPIPYPNGDYTALKNISIIRQIMIYPPMIFNSPSNKRKGMFERVNFNPVRGLHLDPEEWVCYPAKVGDLVVMIYFSMRFFELGFSLCNLFELAESDQITQQPDAIYLFGVPEIPGLMEGQSQTIFYDDEENHMLVAAVPCRDEFGYFGYLKKMVLTLHNIIVMKRGRLPYHGAYFHIRMRSGKESNVLIVGDTGAGKSETLEALRQIAGDEVEELIPIADDMGSLQIDSSGKVAGFGTEIGAFVRLDDLQSGYAWGQIDRTIIMNPDQTNARVVIPITTYDEVMRGYPVDVFLYANNYEVVDQDYPIIRRFENAQDALEVFRSGAVMSKGTTNTKGLVHSYFANIFGPPQYQDLHEELAVRYFDQLFKQNVFVGELRTQLGVPGKEQEGPLMAAKALLKLIS